MENISDFEHIYKQYWEKLYAFSFKMTRDSHLAQNIVQDVFIDLWERKKEPESVEHYLFRAVKNQILKHYRNNRFDPALLEEKLEAYLVENGTTDESEIAQKLYDSLEKLPEKRKEILVMNKLEEKNIDQIAEELNLSKQTVKNQLTSAIKQLRFDLKDAFTLAFLLHLLERFIP
jgi:RNA polymerase sigma-70 factor (ECF subfamily)